MNRHSSRKGGQEAALLPLLYLLLHLLLLLLLLLLKWCGGVKQKRGRRGVGGRNWGDPSGTCLAAAGPSR
jgi:hypothetical protein